MCMDGGFAAGRGGMQGGFGPGGRPRDDGRWGPGGRPAGFGGDDQMGFFGGQGQGGGFGGQGPGAGFGLLGAPGGQGPGNGWGGQGPGRFDDVRAMPMPQGGQGPGRFNDVFATQMPQGGGQGGGNFRGGGGGPGNPMGIGGGGPGMGPGDDPRFRGGNGGGNGGFNGGGGGNGGPFAGGGSDPRRNDLMPNKGGAPGKDGLLPDKMPDPASFMTPGGYDAWQQDPYGDHNGALSGTLGFSQQDLARHNPGVDPNMFARSQNAWANTPGAIGMNGKPTTFGDVRNNWEQQNLTQNQRDFFKTGMGMLKPGGVGDTSGLTLSVDDYGKLDGFMGKNDLDAQAIVDKMNAGEIPFPKGYKPPPKSGEITKRANDQRRKQEEQRRRGGRG